MDINEDKKHPIKKNRPLASGKVSTNIAKLFFVVLFIFSLSCAFIVSVNLFFVLVVYFCLNIAYSLKLKHISIIDIFVISIGFVLRLFVGESVSDVSLSMWIIIMTFLLALFLAIAKRRDDVLLANDGKEVRKNIDGYNLEFVNAVMVFMAGVIVVAYIFYTISLDSNNRLYLTAFFVILGILRYMQITFVEQTSGSPTKIVLKDKFLQLTILFWLVSFICIAKL